MKVNAAVQEKLCVSEFSMLDAHRDIELRLASPANPQPTENSAQSKIRL